MARRSTLKLSFFNCSVVVFHVFEVLLFPLVSLTFFVFLPLHFRHGYSTFIPLKGMLLQGPIFMSFFFAVSYNTSSFHPILPAEC
jgi:hypothetical protein